MGRNGEVIWNGSWLINVLFCDGFSTIASVLTVAEMTFRLAYILNVTFVTLYHINENGRRTSDVCESFIGTSGSVNLKFTT